MASPVAQLLDELVQAINSPAGQTALGGGTIPARRGYQTTEELRNQESAAVWLSPSQWRPIGKCGGLSLQQQLIELRFLHKQPKPENEPIDASVAQAEALRDYLQTFVGTHGGRVETVLGPFNIDREKLTFPGQASVGLVLDCDILTGTAATDADPTEPGRLTIARNAVWEAIDNWTALANVFERTYKTSADFAELQLRDPSPAELPAIALYWADIKPDWRTNRMQEWPLTMRLTAWFPGDRHTYAETILEHIFDAIYQYTATGDTAPYIQKTLGFPPKRVDSLTVQSVTLGRSQQTHAIRADVAFTLRSNKDPFGDA